MKNMFLVLMIFIIMGCTTLRYDDDLQEPYTQTEIEISGVATIIITALGILSGSIIYNGIK